MPTMVLVEISEASRRGTIQLADGFTSWCDKLLSSPHFIVDLTVEAVVKAEELYRIEERGNRLIAATAALLDLPLITRDPSITGVAGIEVVW